MRPTCLALAAFVAAVHGFGVTPHAAADEYACRNKETPEIVSHAQMIAERRNTTVLYDVSVHPKILPAKIGDHLSEADSVARIGLRSRKADCRARIFGLHVGALDTDLELRPTSDGGAAISDARVRRRRPSRCSRSRSSSRSRTCTRR